MKKILFLLLISITAVAQVGKDPNATAILDETNKKFKSFKSFKADFSYTIESTSTGKKEVIKGAITVKGNKFFIKFASGDETINDGKMVWNYFSTDNEVNIFDNEESENNMTPTKIVEMYKKGYKYVKIEDQDVNGTKCNAVDLEPDISPEKKKQTQVYKIRIFVDANTKEIKRWKIFERNGNRYTMDIVKFTPNIAVQDNFFAFDKAKHPGVVVEDMR